MTNVSSNQPWQQRLLNQSGIRRLKIVDVDLMLILRLRKELVPQSSFTFYEFIFPSDLSCIASWNLQQTESGSAFWSQSISFTLPHTSDEMVQWAADHANTQWLVITEDYNDVTRVFGGSLEGLELGFEATTGSAPRDGNPMSFTLSSQQLLPYLLLPAYEDDILFPNGAGFSYGFSTGFNS